MRLPVHVPVERLPAAQRSDLSPKVRAALLSAMDSGTHAVGLFDAEDRLLYSNEAFRRAWAIDDAHDATFETIMRNCHRTRQGAIVATQDIDAWLVAARRNRRDGPADRSFEVDLWDGRWMWLTERRLDDGWLLFIAQDITPLKRSERTLRLARDVAIKASLTDPLTQLPNRRHAMQVLDANIARREPFHIALIDIDSFKQINDRYGHAAGDDVLVLLSSELTQLEVRNCFVARLAGDEFLVMSASHVVDEFEAILRELLDQRRRQCETSNASTTFGMSIGSARFPNHGTDGQQLLRAADDAMYRAKSRGKCTLHFA